MAKKKKRRRIWKKHAKIKARTKLRRIVSFLKKEREMRWPKNL